MAKAKTTKPAKVDKQTAAEKAAAKGEVTRLKAHRANHAIVEQHVQGRTITEYEFYPSHDQRTESPAYSKAHKHMTIELDLPCLVCGVKYSTRKNAKANPFGAKAMETHHHIVEWALAEAIDVDKFNKQLLPSLAHKHPNNPEWHYEQPFTAQKVLDWVDHSQDNLWVLCDVHHRAKYVGIHEITYPIWAPQDLFKPDFDDWVKDKIKRLKAGEDPRDVFPNMPAKPKGAPAKPK